VTKRINHPGPRRVPGVTAPTCAAGVLLMALGTPCQAFDIDVGNKDLDVVLNNTVRYNWARRMQEVDPHVAQAGPLPAYAYATADNLFKKGDTITNRLDLLSELNVTYKGQYGMRVSAAAWYDNAYQGKNPQTIPGTSALGTWYQNNEFTDSVKRYYNGPSAEFLDAFVFGNFNLGGADVNARLGRHAVIWGESLIGSNHAIAYSQAPVDARKAVSSPGASAKETAMPVNQLSFTALVGPTVTLLGQYQFEWRASRVPEGGTYFAPGDAVLEGPNKNRGPEVFKGKAGAFGLGMKWAPEWLDGTLGFYYRQFDDNLGAWLSQPTANPTPTSNTATYARGIKLYGVSLSKNVLGMSFGSEISYRADGELTSSTTATQGLAGRYEGARGNTWHALANVIKTFGPSPVFDSASVAAEVNWAKLDHITTRPDLYRAFGHASDCTAAANLATAWSRGCVTHPFTSVALSMSAGWTQVLPGVDLSLPVFISRTFGNSPSAGGGSDGFLTYKVGLGATYRAIHQFDLSYTGWHQKIDVASAPQTVPGLGTVYGRILGAPYSDKGFLSFTYQTTF
jgi:hypothetical protein